MSIQDKHNNNNNVSRVDQDNRRRAEEILLSSVYSSSAGIRPDSIRYRHRKKKFFSPEEKARILDRVKTVGVTQAAREADTYPDVVERWLKDIDKMIAETNDTAESQEKSMTPEPIKEDKEGTKEMKKGKDFTPAERDTIIARAAEIGATKAAEEAGTSSQVIAGWMTRMSRQAKKNAEPKKITTDIIPGQNGMPAKRDDYHDYTPEERRILVAKADEVGNVAVRDAYGLKNYNLHDWRKITSHQKSDKPETPKQPEKPAVTEKPAEPVQTVTIAAPIQQPAPVTNYPPEVEVLLLREKVAALTAQVETLREMIRSIATRL